MKFGGAIYKGEDLPRPYDSVEDHYVQIGKNLYMGPSGNADDFVNHSCEPNSKLVIKNSKKVHLEAIRNISPGEEIVWDYSTTIDEGDDSWEMRCQCGKDSCRKIVSDFRRLPEKIKNKYLRDGIFPEYINRQLNY